MTQRLWQIASPPRFQTHEHMAGLRRWIERVTQYAQKQGDIVMHFPWVHVPPAVNATTLNFHTHGYDPQSYHFKESFLQDWVQIDSHGYTGWHSSNLKPGLMPVAPARQGRMAAKLDQYLQSRKSKYEQNSSAAVFDFDYLFFPLQKPQDETSLFARFTPQEIVDAILPWLKQHHIKLVIKRHPFCHSDMVAAWLDRLQHIPEIVMTDGNVVDILPHAAAVITVNSSVGFEAVMRGIPVLSFGASEYGYMTEQVFDLEKLPQQLQQLQRQDQRNAVTDFAAAHLYDIDDDQDIIDLYNALRCPRTHNLPAILPEIDFSEGGNGAAYCLHGFSYPEAWGAWTNADKATIAFWHKDPAVMKKITVQFHSYTKQDHPVQIFSLLWNGVSLGPWQQHPYKEVSVQTSFTANIQPGINALSFVLHDPVRPAELKDEFDIRKLGLGLERMIIQEMS